MTASTLSAREKSAKTTPWRVKERTPGFTTTRPVKIDASIPSLIIFWPTRPPNGWEVDGGGEWKRKSGVSDVGSGRRNEGGRGSAEGREVVLGKEGWEKG